MANDDASGALQDRVAVALAFGAEDPDVLAAAVAEDRILVTLDRDFTNVLIYPPEATAGVAVVQLGKRMSRTLLASVIDAFLTACEQNLIRGKLWIIEPGQKYCCLRFSRFLPPVAVKKGQRKITRLG